MLTAAARTARSLIWPADVPESGDLADAFAARLDALAKRAQHSRHAPIFGGGRSRRAGHGTGDDTRASTLTLRYDWQSMSVSEPIATRRMLSLDADVLRVAQKVREVGRALDERYLDKSELVRMLLVTLVAGEHMLIVGPPGTAKSALVRHLARLIDARYFEYLLTRFSEPNEIFGPIDIKAFREGTLRAPRRGDAARRGHRVPRRDLQVELRDLELAAQHPQRAALLHGQRQHPGAAVLALRRHQRDPQRRRAGRRLRSLPRARRCRTTWTASISTGWSSAGLRGEVEALAARGGDGEAVVEARRARWSRWPRSACCKARLARHLQFPEDFLARYKGLVFQIRSEGVTLSDRRVVKLLKLFAASALDRRPADGRRRRLLRAPPRLEQRRSDPDRRRHRRAGARAASPRASRGSACGAPARAISTASWPSWASSAASCSAASRCPTSSCSRSSATCRTSAPHCRRSAPTPRSTMAGEVDKLLEGVFESSKWSGWTSRWEP